MLNHKDFASRCIKSYIVTLKGCFKNTLLLCGTGGRGFDPKTNTYFYLASCNMKLKDKNETKYVCVIFLATTNRLSHVVLSPDFTCMAHQDA